MPKLPISELIGSSFRDWYRYMHKQNEYYSSDGARNRCTASDVDLIEIRNGKIVAITDIKNSENEKNTGLSKHEKIAYLELSKALNVPVFIIWADPSWGQFEVESWPEKKYHQTFYSKEQFFQCFIEDIENITKTAL